MDPALYFPTAPLTRLAEHVVLELTDRESLEHVTDVRDRIERLRALGYRIALDDVGAGQAGLDTFSRLEPEFVKVDTSIIRAEGVETEEERGSLLETGCDFMQGYFLGRPGPIADED
jgi:EAL domain-containing protein (putative c-di-GMP-specific phosphodiesterase class I)